MGKGGIPEGWLDYTKLGMPMGSDPSKAIFVSFKVPLKQQLTESLKESETFSPANLITMCEEAGMKLGLVIDLTFTKRYYNPIEFTREGITYVKIPVEGQVVPRKARVAKFTETVRSYLENKTDDKAVIGVHCTHGLNRTGYIICKYLIEEEKMNPDDAIKLFNSCRGHELERETYLNNLRTEHIPPAEKDSYYREGYDGAPQFRTRSHPYERSSDAYGYNNYHATPSQHGGHIFDASVERRSHKDHYASGSAYRDRDGISSFKTGNSYSRGADFYSTGSSSCSRENNSHYRKDTSHSRRSHPYSRERNPYSTRSDPYSIRSDPYSIRSDPYSRESNSYFRGGNSNDADFERRGPYSNSNKSYSRSSDAQAKAGNSSSRTAHHQSYALSHDNGETYYEDDFRNSFTFDSERSDYSNSAPSSSRDDILSWRRRKSQPEGASNYSNKY